MRIQSSIAGLSLMTATVLSAGSAFASDALVDAKWVQDNVNNPKVRIFEVSVDTGVYERGHIPGAVHLNWHTDLVDPQKRDIASREAFEKILRDAGVDKDTTIVLYGDNINWFAAWGAWVFEVYGLGSQVKLLDGGRKLWEAQGLPLDTALPDYADSSLALPDRDNSVRARFGDVLAVAEGRNAIKLVDIRSADEYSGKIFAPEGVKELAVRAGFPAPLTFPGERLSKRTARSSRSKKSRPFMLKRGSMAQRRLSPIAGSANDRATPGSR